MDNEQLFDALKAYFDQRLQEMEGRQNEALYNLETKLISEFWKWGRTTEAKLKVIPIFEERLSAIETRVFSVEEKTVTIRQLETAVTRAMEATRHAQEEIDKLKLRMGNSPEAA